MNLKDTNHIWLSLTLETFMPPCSNCILHSCNPGQSLSEERPSHMPASNGESFMPTCLLSPLHRFSAYKLLKLKLLSRAYHNKEIASEIAFYFSMIENVNEFMNHLLQGMPQIWQIWFLLLHTTSAWLYLQHLPSRALLSQCNI